MIVVSVKCLIIIAKRSLKIVEIIHAKNLSPSLSTDKRKLNTKLIYIPSHIRDGWSQSPALLVCVVEKL